ncbi:PREDICTED: L-type lectin-domain containing receptor kinase IV.1-like isoform X4 [Camelina sativa]|uniref:L-type lectin-domain containing receptor kinase IV.1-like isoform X4 n=1 Tax=Camelina sativa TaxID=90675 RepID=A0ABM1RU20_CAMSA|nr:PREDICTED: L-type lectin-domain containing receptor kinase IV.1-like isoform X4 [Camelina sativa]
MFLKLFTIFLFCFLSQSLKSSSQTLNFIYNNGFNQQKDISIQGITTITPNGLLKLTNTTVQKTGHAFYTKPIRFKDSQNGTVSSFSTTFVFAINPQIDILSGHGIAFVVAPKPGLPDATPSQYLGLFNIGNNGNDTNHVFAVELDTIRSTEFNDTDDNHVGIDINSLKSVNSAYAGWWDEKAQFKNLSLISRKPMQVWVDYDGRSNKIDVTMAPFNEDKPLKPLVSAVRDLSSVLLQDMYVGFSSATGSVLSEHYVLGWSFGLNEKAPPLALSRLPKLPRFPLKPLKISDFYKIGMPLISLFLIFSFIFLVFYIVRRRRKFAEELEDWEKEFGKNRFRFKDLYYATKGFKEKDLLGSGGFGSVYKGVMPGTKLEIAVKRVSHESRQGMKEFVAEIVSIGRMSHRNLVPLLGYCRRRGELLLVYDFMPNGSLDKYLYNTPEVTLNWKQRIKVILGVGSGLFYLHEEWEQVVIHRDVKASNVLLDGELNGRLGDFGLARLYDHGSDPQTTHVVGTLGYLAPEHTRTGRATTATDVFAFGAFLLEVTCGRRPIEMQHETDETFLLVDWVFGLWNKGNILAAKDPNMGSEYDEKEVEMVLKLGLLCSHSDPRARPSMRQVLHYLRGDAKLPDLSPLDLSGTGMMFGVHDGFSELGMSYSSSVFKGFTGGSSIADSQLSGGR